MTSTSCKEADCRLRKRVLCVGMCVLDIIHVCECFPTEDTDKRCQSGYWQRGGNASNNCTVLRQLGAECEFLGILSNSSAFRFLLEDCRKRSIRIDNCPRVLQDPPFSSVILVKNTDSRTIIHSNSNFPILRFEHFQNISLDTYKWIHFEARNAQETLKMLGAIHSHNKIRSALNEQILISIELEKVCVDNFVLIPLAHLVFLGKDLALHMNWQNSKQAVYGLREMISDLALPDNIKSSLIPDIICTWGAQGSSCLSSKNEYTHVEATPPKEIVDSLGAGDTFCAAVIYAKSHRGWSLPDAVAFGNSCAGFKLAHQGYDAIANFPRTNAPK